MRLGGRGLLAAALKIRAMDPAEGDWDVSTGAHDGVREWGRGTAAAIATSRCTDGSGVLIRDGSAVLDLDDWRELGQLGRGGTRNRTVARTGGWTIIYNTFSGGLRSLTVGVLELGQ